MLRNILVLFLTIFSITPPIGDSVEILQPSRPLGDGKALHGLYAGIQAIKKHRGGHWKYSFPRLPNISSFEIKLGYFNPLLLAFGLAGRLPGVITTTKNNNHRVNRYLVYVQLRLMKELDNPIKYWRISGSLIQRSNVYMIGCLHMIDKNSYRKLTYRQMKCLLREIDMIRGRIHGQMSPHLLYHRTYIPKGTDSFRPLGVPSLAWRVYLNMLLHPLVMVVHLHNSQHGFRPGKGTLTAWKTILKEVIGSPHIYEFDLKQCFPSISLPRLEYNMTKVYGVPKLWSRYYTALNFVPPIFKSNDLKLDEAQALASIRSGEFNHDYWLTSPTAVREGVPMPRYFAEKNNALTIFANSGTTPDVGKFLRYMAKHLPPVVLDPEKLKDPSLPTITTLPNDVLNSFLSSLEGISTFRKLEIDANIERSVYGSTFFTPSASTFLPTQEWVKLVGTAQGSSLSPFLAAIALDEIRSNLDSDVKILLYADDGIFYGPGTEEFVRYGIMDELTSRLGFTIHPEKSGWVKKDDTWLKPLKFLGLTYNGWYDLLSASTRKGSTLVYNKQELLEAEYDVAHAMELSSNGLRAKLFEAVRMEHTYRVLGQFGKRMIASNLIDYYRRLFFLIEALVEIRVPSSESTYDASFDAFIWYYYILVSRIFYMSRDRVIQFLCSGVLGLIDRRAVQAYLTANFLPSGLEAVPSAQQMLHNPAEETVGSYLRRLKVMSEIFSSPKRESEYASVSQGKSLHFMQTAPYLWLRAFCIMAIALIKILLVNPIFYLIQVVINLIDPLLGYRITGAILHFQNWLAPLLGTVNRFMWFARRFLIEILSLVFPHTSYGVLIDSLPGIVVYDKFFGFPLYHLRQLFLLEANNKYLKAHRNQYTWSNFIKSSYAGFILSRLYNNTYMFDDFVQNFKYIVAPCSIGASLRAVLGRELSVFTGTSYAVRKELALCKKLQRVKRPLKVGNYLPVKYARLNGQDRLWSGWITPNPRVM